MNELARFLLENLYLDFQGGVTIERIRELLRASDTRESRALLARLIEDQGVDDMLVVIADCLKEHLATGINADVISEQLRTYGES